MAEKLLAIYNCAKEAGGLTAQMRLAMLTVMSAQKAAIEPDSPENLAKFAAAYKEITNDECPIK